MRLLRDVAWMLDPPFVQRRCARDNEVYRSVQQESIDDIRRRDIQIVKSDKSLAISPQERRQIALALGSLQKEPHSFQEPASVLWKVYPGKSRCCDHLSVRLLRVA